MSVSLIIVYFLSVLIAACGALYVLHTELADDRKKLECSWQNYELSVTWLNIVLGLFVVLMPIMNTIVAVVIIGTMLDRPVVKRKKS